MRPTHPKIRSQQVCIASLGSVLPMEVSTPLTENRSLMETGRPCRGPIVLPVLARYSSIPLAIAKASSKKISVQHVVNW